MTALVTWFNASRKTIAALVGGLISWAYVVNDSVTPGVTTGEWIGLAVVVATALGVYGVANKN